MPNHLLSSFSVLLTGLLCAYTMTSGAPDESAHRSLSVTDTGAIGDSKTMNTKAIQDAIDRLASSGGGTLIVPKGVFITGAIFLKSAVNLHLDEGAVLKGSTNLEDYPKSETRIEGHFQNWVPAVLNGANLSNCCIDGTGMLDGSGQVFWKEFWDRRKQDPKTTNLDVERPRLMYLVDSKNVKISGIRLKDSGFWNLHLYRCDGVVIDNIAVEVPDRVKCPSTDGTDIDSCQNVMIRNSTYNVDDDCIALKGSKGPLAAEDKDSPGVEHVRIENCTFLRGNGAVTLGSEATAVRDVVVTNCNVNGSVRVAVFKLRPDTPQCYEDIHFKNIELHDSSKPLISVEPWKQYFDLKGQPPPKSLVRNVTMSEVRGHGGSFGVIRGNPGQTEICDIAFLDIDVQLKNEAFEVVGVQNLKMENVRVNGKTCSPPLP